MIFYKKYTYLYTVFLYRVHPGSCILRAREQFTSPWAPGFQLSCVRSWQSSCRTGFVPAQSSWVFRWQIWRFGGGGGWKKNPLVQNQHLPSSTQYVRVVSSDFCIKNLTNVSIKNK